MNSYFSVIAFIRAAAYLTGEDPDGQCAYLGALSQNRDLGELPTAGCDGAGVAPESARGFNFGVRCGQVFYNAIGELTDDEIVLADIAAAKVFLLDLDSPAARSIIESTPPDMLVKHFERIIRSFVRQTESAAEGIKDEKMNALLQAYDDLRADFLRSIPDFALSLVMEPSDGEREFFLKFIDPGDPVIALVTSQKTVNPKRLHRALDGNRSIFGGALAAVINNDMAVR